MRAKRGIRIESGGNRRNTDVYDLETGDKLLCVYSINIEMDAQTGIYRTTVVTGDAWVFEGTAELVTPDETVPLTPGELDILVPGPRHDAG